MEIAIIIGHRLENLLRQAQAQVNALTDIKNVLETEADHLHRHDQVLQLDALQARIRAAVRHIHRRETSAASAFTKSSLLMSLVKFTAGSVMAAMSDTNEHPIATGWRSAEMELARTAPFGTVLVEIGPSGIPDGVRVISLSQQARERHTSELLIQNSLESRGYGLMTPEIFSASLDQLKEKVLNGTINLPVAASSLVQEETVKGLKAVPSLPP